MVKEMDGIIIVNKPKNWTSHDIVAKVKKLTNEKVGHTGTLDPMATGVLPLLIGKGTLCSKYLMNHDKKYQVILQLGKRTDTLDSEGEILEEKEVKIENLEESKVGQVFETLKGKQEQIPPMYSAIKVNGKKLYEYARKGQNVEVKPRIIEIYNIELIRINKEEKQIEFTVECSKGTYIRSLCETIAEKLETVGYMFGLNRLQVGEFGIEQSISIDEISKNPEKIEKNLISIEELFKKIEKIEINEKELKLLLNGVQLSKNKKDGIYRVYQEKSFIGIGIIKNQKLKRDIII